MYIARRKGWIMSVHRHGGCASRRAPVGDFHRLGGAVVLALGVFGSVAGLAGCAHGVDGSSGPSSAVPGEASTSYDDAGSETSVPLESGSSLDADATSSEGDTSVLQGDAADAQETGPTVLMKQQLCKLINGQAEGDPTANQAPTLANLAGTELGIPVEVSGTLYFFFGDSH